MATANKHLGECGFHVGTGEFIARLGVLEIASLESSFGVQGIGAVYAKGFNPEDRTAFIQLTAAALSRHHPKLMDTKDQSELADIIDWRENDDEGNKISPLAVALIAAFRWSMPEADPNATPATPMKETSESTLSE